MDYIRYLRSMVGTAEETARREVLEETGLTVGVLTLFEVFSSRELISFSNGDRTQIVTVSYLTDEVRGTLRPDSEGLELCYFALGALPAPLFVPNVPILEAIKRRFAS